MQLYDKQGMSSLYVRLRCYLMSLAAPHLIDHTLYINFYLDAFLGHASKPYPGYSDLVPEAFFDLLDASSERI